MSTLYSRNILPSSIIVNGYNVYSVDSSSIEMVDIQDNNSHKYRSFKYVINNTSYYYVVDGIHNVWINDLSSIGYSEVPSVVLPTVNTTNNIYHRLRFNKSGDDYTFSARGITSVYSDSPTDPTYVDWDSTKVYGVIKYYNSDQTFVGRQGITPIEAPSWGEAGKIYMKNNSGDSLIVSKIRVATCSDSTATVVTVYDSNNVAYNAFKFTASGTDYYYVLDGVQTEWTNDLASIGYSLTPSVVLPEVVLLGKAEYDYWLYVGATTANITLSSGNNCPLYSDRGSSSYGWTTYPKAVISCQKYEYSEYWNVAKGRTGLSLVMSTLSGVQWPGCQNDLNESITFIRLKAAYCKNESATVVTVYNSSNVAYNAFKFTASGTDYYYVLDGTQTDWTDDLAAAGYTEDSPEPPVVLPTVSASNTAYAYSAADSSTVNLSEGSYFIGKNASGNPLGYDTQVSYAVYSMFASKTGSVEWFCAYFSTSNNQNNLAIINSSDNPVTVHRVNYAVCSSSQATVVTVYNSSNVAYNSFKYTANNTDYYYVLDGVQADWTDDLSGIGYSLTPTAQTAYLNTPNNTQSLPMVGDGIVYTYILFNESGNWLSTSNDYTLVGYHASVDGPLLSFEGTGVYLLKDTTYGRMKITSNGAMRVSIQRIEYTVS